MILTAYESIEKAIVDRLRADGHVVDYIMEIARGAKDQSVLDHSVSMNSVLSTSDKDFGELVSRLAKLHTGIALVRLEGFTLARKIDEVSNAFREHGHELPGNFAVLTPDSIRVRPGSLDQRQQGN